MMSGMKRGSCALVSRSLTLIRTFKASAYLLHPIWHGRATGPPDHGWIHVQSAPARSNSLWGLGLCAMVDLEELAWLKMPNEGEAETV